MKIRKIFLLMVLMFIFVPMVHASSTVTEVTDIGITPIPSGRRIVYINNMSNYEIVINDTTNFKILTKDSDTKYIVIHNKPTSDKTYDNPYYVMYDKIGYYIDDNGNPVYLDAKISVNELSLDFGSYSSDNGDPYYSVGVARATVFGVNSYSMNNSAENRDIKTGMHDKITLTLYNDNGSALSNDIVNTLAVQWGIVDLDVGDKTTGETKYSQNGTPLQYVESIKFNTGFNSTYYVLRNTLLRFADDNNKFIATALTGNDGTGTGQPAKAYSTVVAYQIANNATVEWWGSGCGTSIFAVASRYPYPNLSTPKKAVDASIVSVGDTVNYTVTETFPYTESINKASSIELSDEFNASLDISGLTYKVLDKNNNDVTSSWTKTVTGQKVVLKYTGTDTTTVTGKYTFKFNNLKVLEPGDSNETSVTDGTNYKIIPNTANVKVTGLNDVVQSKDTNTVKIKILYSDLNLIKEVISYPNNGNPQVGDRIEYKFTIINAGPSRLTNVVLTDIMDGLVIDSGMKDTLESGETITVYGHYALTSSDVNKNKTFYNEATVVGTDPSGNRLTSTDNATVELIVNPKTGSIATLVAIVLVLMLTLTFYLYKKNIKRYNEVEK